MTDADGRASASFPVSAWIRIVLRGFGIAVWLLVCLSIYLVCLPFTTRNPAPRLFFSGICRILGIRLTLHGKRTGKGAFLLANHVSWMDIPALCTASGTAFVAHDGLAKNPLMRRFCLLNDTVFIARHDRRSIAAQVEQVREAIRDTGALTIFPEGSTGDGLGVLPFKSSLLSALTPIPSGISVQPVWLDYGPRSNEIAWVGEESGLGNFLKIASRCRSIDLNVHFLPQLAGEELADRKAMATAARNAIIQRKHETEAKRGQRVAL